MGIVSDESALLAEQAHIVTVVAAEQGALRAAMAVLGGVVPAPFET